MREGADRWRLFRLALSEAGRIVRTAFARLAKRPVFLLRVTPGRLIIASQDLRTSDPTVAGDIYAGLYVFAGRVLTTGGRSPFQFPPPSYEWGENLYGFGWLRHLRAADTVLARSNARALVDEFVSGGGDRRLARDTCVVARRLISFLSQSPLVLDGADHAFYRRYLRSIARAIRQLEIDTRRAIPPAHNLMAAIALCYAGLCCEGLEGVLRRATRLLVRELDRQILPDGGHLGRNPAILIELLLDLMPLWQAYASRGFDPPEPLGGAIDRMLPLLRLLRHEDGTISHFNGMGVSAPDHLATLFIYGGARGPPMRRAPHAGYERLEAGETLVVAEVGAAPQPLHAREAHAGCLSFELSSGAHRIVVNCGAPRASPETRLASRSTPGHSTVTVGGLSSGEFLDRGGWWGERALCAWLVGRLGPALIHGPTDVPVERVEDAGATMLSATHDGYRGPFGILHERLWRVSPDGKRLDGEDHLVRETLGGAPVRASLRFHLHPAVKASRDGDGRVITLALPNGEAWQFEADPAEPEIEESVFFAATDRARRAEQIVVTVEASGSMRVRWRFTRVAQAHGVPAGPTTT